MQPILARRPNSSPASVEALQLQRPGRTTKTRDVLGLPPFGELGGYPHEIPVDKLYHDYILFQSLASISVLQQKFGKFLCKKNLHVRDLEKFYVKKNLHVRDLENFYVKKPLRKRSGFY
jgi:hypothetical protein